MNINKILSASVIIGVILLSSTACSSSQGVPEPAPTASSSSSTDATQTPEKGEDSIEVEYVLDTINGYYDFISQSDSSDKVRKAGADLTGRTATDAELQDVAANFPEGFQYFDTSSPKKIKNAYRAMMMGSNAGQGSKNVEIIAPREGVSVDGDTATFNTTWINVTKDGKNYPSSPETSPDPEDVINLVKKANGNWVIVAKDAAIQVTSP